VLAWHTAALCGAAWAGKLPKLESVLRRPGSQQQTPSQQKTVIHMLSARYGLPIKRTRLIRKDTA
jgi:hypothetical protein